MKNFGKQIGEMWGRRGCVLFFQTIERILSTADIDLQSFLLFDCSN